MVVFLPIIPFIHRIYGSGQLYTFANNPNDHGHLMIVAQSTACCVQAYAHGWAVLSTGALLTLTQVDTCVAKAWFLAAVMLWTSWRY